MINSNNNNRVRPIDLVDASIAAYNLNMIEEMSGRRVDTTAAYYSQLSKEGIHPVDLIDANIAAYNIDMIEELRRGDNSGRGNSYSGVRRASDLMTILIAVVILIAICYDWIVENMYILVTVGVVFSIFMAIFTAIKRKKK